MKTVQEIMDEVMEEIDLSNRDLSPEEIQEVEGLKDFYRNWSKKQCEEAWERIRDLV